MGSMVIVNSMLKHYKEKQKRDVMEAFDLDWPISSGLEETLIQPLRVGVFLTHGETKQFLWLGRGTKPTSWAFPSGLAPCH